MTGDKKVKTINKGGPVGFVLFLAWLGALVYFVQNSVGFGGLLLAIAKSIVWPAYIVHGVLRMLGA